MVKSFIKSVFQLGVVLVLALGIGTGIRLLTSPEPHKSAFTHDEIAKINPVMVIDAGTLIDPKRFGEYMVDMVGRLSAIGILIPTPFGHVINPSARNYAIPVIIQSRGGYVRLGNEYVGFVQELRKAGIKVNCYVGEAQSTAFHILVVTCDKVIAKRSARLMQHRTHCGAGCSTPATFLSDIELSRKEAQALGVNYDEWHNLTRGEEDHVFSLLEIEKYKLVDEWMD